MKKIGFIGLGRMGTNMVENLLDHRYKVVVYNRSIEPTKKLVRKGASPSYFLEEFMEKLGKNKIIWIMIKSGKPVEDTIKNLIPYLNKGDTIIDGGNSFYKDSIRRHDFLQKKKINFLDCGTSGGIEGARHGACMMVGGDKKTFDKIEFLFRDFCAKDAYAYVGKSGAGHFVKAVHNGVEYVMMGGLGEGFEILNKNKNKLNINLKEVSKVYANASIIEGKLTKWLWESFKEKNYLEKIKGVVPQGETEKELETINKVYKMNLIKTAINQRKLTRKKSSYAGKIISALRNKFGGHKIIEK